jgi:phospholipid transport system substrate-binding protein
MINRRAWSAAAAAMLAMGTWAAALPVHAADETPDALIKRVSTDVLETIKKDPSLREGDVSKSMTRSCPM